MRAICDGAVKRRWRWSALLGLVALSTVLGGARATTTPPGTEDAAGFEPTPCWSPEAAAAPVRCGYLTVPESRERPNGRSIRIAVAILTPEGTAPDALPSPLVYLAGGPGGSAGLSGEFFAVWLDWYAQWDGAQDRTLILVDQRGTGESEPRLQCDPDLAERTMRAYYSVATPGDPFEHAEWWRRYLLDCRAPFDAAGIDVTAYNTAENAADLVALRRALGIAQWDVWGVSYGTELALELLRIDEAGFRSLILDSVSLYSHPDIVVGNFAASFDRALKRIFRDCLLDQDCKANFPGLSAELAHGFLRLNRQPRTLALSSDYDWDGMQFVLDGRRAAEMLFYAMYVPEFVPYVPSVVFSLYLEKYETAENLANYMVATSALMPMAELMETSTICRTAPEGEALRRLHYQEGRYPNYSALWVAELYQAVCAEWDSPAADPAELGPVHSTVPTLILGGRYDPVTPPEWGRIVAGWLPNSTVIEFPHLAHGSVSLDPCADQIASNFLDRPGEDPQDACFAELATPAFLLP